MVNQTRAIDKLRLFEFIGSLPAALMARAKAVLKLHNQSDPFNDQGILHSFQDLPYCLFAVSIFLDKP